MGIMTDYYFDEIQDLYYNELLNTYDAVLRKTRAIGLAQSQGADDDVPSDECCNLLADYLSAVTKRLEEARREGWGEYQELAECLVDQYVEDFSGSVISLDTLLVAVGEGDVLEEGADPNLIIAAMDVACAMRGVFRNAAGGDPFGNQKIERDFFTIDASPRPSAFVNESWDSVIGAMIEKFEEEL